MPVQPVFESRMAFRRCCDRVVSSAVGWAGLSALKSAAYRLKSTFSACLTSSGFCSASSSTSSYCPLLRTHAAVLSTGDIVAESTGDWTWNRDIYKHFSEKLYKSALKSHLFGGKNYQVSLKTSLAEILHPSLTLGPQHLLESL